MSERRSAGSESPRTLEGRYVAVIGAGECSGETYEAARSIGSELARRGAILVCGGLGGVMEAAARGALEGGGVSVGILPGRTRARACPYLTVALPTGMGEARNALVVRAADGVIAVAGEWGTLSEIGLALKMGKPVVGLETWELAQKGRPLRAYREATGPVEAVTLLEGLWRGDWMV